MNGKKSKRLFGLFIAIIILSFATNCGRDKNFNSENNKSVETIITSNKAKEDDNESINTSIKDKKQFRDINLCNSAYKMFYGEWEIVEIKDSEDLSEIDEDGNQLEKYQAVNYVKDESTGNILKGIGKYVEGVAVYSYSSLPLDDNSKMISMLGNKMIFMPEYIKCNETYVTKKPIYQVDIHPTPEFMKKSFERNMNWDELSYNEPQQPYYVSVYVDFQLEYNPSIDGACTSFMVIDDYTMLGNIIGRSVKLKRINHIENVEKMYIQNSPQELEARTISSPELPNYNMGYKTFYGKWNINRILASPEVIDEDIDSLVKGHIGKQVNMLSNEIKINEKIVTEHPMYIISIIPVLSDDQTYINGLPSIRDLGIRGKFFVFVDVQSLYVNEDYKEPFSKFYIKDDETLIVEENGYYLELKRSEYIDNVEVECDRF